MHKCPTCNYRFEDADSLYRHLNEGRGCPESLAVTVLADATLDCEDIDMMDIVDSARRTLTATAFEQFCHLLEICPVHILDMAICDDDDSPTCRTYRTVQERIAS